MTQAQTLKKTKAGTRKVGSDMTNALLWAAFVIVILVSIMAVYQVVRLNANKRLASESVTMLMNESRLLFSGRNSYDDITNQMLIEAGAVPPEMINGDDITVPYGGVVVLESRSSFRKELNLTVTFPESTFQTRSLCMYMGQGSQDYQHTNLETGPMGVDYMIWGGARFTCTMGVRPEMRVTYDPLRL